jgi:hypothetical protein
MHLHDILRNGSDVTELYFNAKYKKKMKNSVEKDAVQKSWEPVWFSIVRVKFINLLFTSYITFCGILLGIAADLHHNCFSLLRVIPPPGSTIKKNFKDHIYVNFMIKFFGSCRRKPRRRSVQLWGLLWRRRCGLRWQQRCRRRTGAGGSPAALGRRLPRLRGSGRAGRMRRVNNEY